MLNLHLISYKFVPKSIFKGVSEFPKRSKVHYISEGLLEFKACFGHKRQNEFVIACRNLEEKKHFKTLIKGFYC
jgi:hypothetical protein